VLTRFHPDWPAAAGHLIRPITGPAATLSRCAISGPCSRVVFAAKRWRGFQLRIPLSGSVSSGYSSRSARFC